MRISDLGRRGQVRYAFFFFSIAIGLAAAIPLPAVAQSSQGSASPQAERSEFRRLLPLTSFYSTPTPFPAGHPGELIRSEEVYDYQLPEGVSVVRILYHSRSAGGADVASSGVVLTPDQSPPAGGWPVIAWAHGFTGTARHCAPSLMRNLNEGPFLSMYVKLGYAVVATDYTGLGTDFRNASVDMQSNATDVIDSVAASRAAVPHLGRRWIAMGESMGGLAALAVAQSEGGLRDPDYLGSIAVSGVAEAKNLYQQMADGNAASQLVFLAYGVQTLYSSFQVNQVLTEKALALYHQIENTCAASTDFEAGTPMLKPNWEDNSFVRQFFARNTIGRKPAPGPILIISSPADPAVSEGLTAQAITRMCKEHDKVQFHQYQNSESAGVLGDSVRDQLTWIQARFAGRPATSNCP